MISIGLDVGREHDPAALAVLHARGTRPDSHRPAWSLLDVGNIPRRTDYLDLARIAVGLSGHYTSAGFPTLLVIDSTGIGAAVLEMARREAPDQRIYGISISGGMTLSRHGPDEFVVGKHRLTETLRVALEQRGLVVAEHADPDGVREFRSQLAAFGRRPSAARYEKHEALRGHDDLVLAVELAMWIGDAMCDEDAGVRRA